VTEKYGGPGGCATTWHGTGNVDDIDADEDDGKQWVPMMPQMMNMPDARPSGMGLPTTCDANASPQMTMYALHLT